MARPKGKGLHRHGCRSCFKPYEDACETPSENDRCYQCRTGRPGLFDQLGTFTPRECCYSDSRPVRRHKTKSLDETAVYHLSTGCPWWICGSCGMTSPYRKPRRNT